MGATVEFAATPSSVSLAPDDGRLSRREEGRTARAAPRRSRHGERVGLRGPGHQWSVAGKTLTRLPHLLEYWFDWQTYWPKTEAYKPWRPTPKAVDRLEVPKPAS